MDFNPNDIPYARDSWATYIPERRPKFKIHKNAGHAKNAFHYRSDAILYELVEGDWVERYRIEGLAGRPRCSHAGCEEDSYGYEWAKGKVLNFIPKVCSCCRWPEYRGRAGRPKTCLVCPDVAPRRRHDD